MISSVESARRYTGVGSIIRQIISVSGETHRIPDTGFDRFDVPGFSGLVVVQELRLCNGLLEELHHERDVEDLDEGAEDATADHVT